MVYRTHDLCHHALEGHRDKLHIVGGAVTLPQVVHHLAHAHLMSSAAEVEEQEMAAYTAAHHQVSRYRRIVATGDQCHHGFHGTQRIATQALVTAMGNVELVIVHFDAHFHFRIFQIDPTGLGGLHQRAADQSLQVNRTEIVLTMAPCTYCKGFAFQSTGKGLYGLGAHVVQVHKRVNRDFLDGGNAGNSGKFINHRAGQAPAFGHLHINPVPAAIHPDRKSTV